MSKILKTFSLLLIFSALGLILISYGGEGCFSSNKDKVVHKDTEDVVAAPDVDNVEFAKDATGLSFPSSHYIAKKEKRKLVLQSSQLSKKTEVVVADDLNIESIQDNSHPVPFNLVFLISAGGLMPFGKSVDFSGSGCGGSFSIEKRDLFASSVELGFETGFFYLTGLDRLDSENRKIKRIFFIPLSFYCGYSFNFFGALHFVPFVSAGGAFINGTRFEQSFDNSSGLNKQVKTAGPLAGAGAALSWRPGCAFEFGLRVSTEFLPLETGFSSYPFARLEIFTGLKI